MIKLSSALNGLRSDLTVVVKLIFELGVCPPPSTLPQNSKPAWIGTILGIEHLCTLKKLRVWLLEFGIHVVAATKVDLAG